MSKILVVDDMAICREPIEAALANAGYTTFGASGGREALDILAREHADLVLLDVNMPDLDGLAVLRVIRKNPRFRGVKVIFLTETADKTRVIEAGRLGIQGYLLKSRFSLNDMMSLIQRALGEATDAGAAASGRGAPTRKAARAAPASGAKSSALPGAQETPSLRLASPVNPQSVLAGLSPVITREALRKLVSQGLELKPLGPSVHSVLRTTSSPQCSADDVAQAVATDQALSVRILKLANSSLYSRGRPVDGVKDAITRLGIQEVRNLVMALGVVDRYDGLVSRHMDPRLFWEHSMACGLIASVIAKACKRNDVEDAFLWGMLHDVGRLVMIDHVPDQYAAVFDAANASGLPLERIEPKLLRVDHCEILAQALEHWRFPREMIAPTVGHHQPIGKIKRAGPAATNAPGIIALADRLAHALLLGNSGNDTLYRLDDVVRALHVDDALVAKIVADVPAETNALKFSMVAQSEDGVWPDYQADVRRRIGVPLRPLCIASEPVSDPYVIFCDRITEPGIDETPNLGVLHVNDPAAFPQLSEQYQSAEAEASTEPLPLILIYAAGELESPPWLATRPHVVLAPPVRVTTFVKAASDLMKSVSAMHAPAYG